MNTLQDPPLDLKLAIILVTLVFYVSRRVWLKQTKSTESVIIDSYLLFLPIFAIWIFVDDVVVQLRSGLVPTIQSTGGNMDVYSTLMVLGIIIAATALACGLIASMIPLQIFRQMPETPFLSIFGIGIMLLLLSGVAWYFTGTS